MTTELELAARRAARLYRSRQFQGIYVKGARAAQDGRPRSACPYPVDVRKTWNAVRRKAWLRGFDSLDVPASEA